MNRKLFLFLKVTLKNAGFQSLRTLGLKMTILQAFKVVLFYPKKWVEIFPNSPNCDVTLLPRVCLRCQSALLGSERAWKETCLAIQK